MIKVSPTFYITMSAFWTLVSLAALISTCWRIVSYHKKDRVDRFPVLDVFGFLFGYLDWSTANRLVTSLWFSVLGVLVLAAKPPDKISPLSLAFILGILVINVMILVSNQTDYNRWLMMRARVITTYARDVDRGIRDALRRLGVYINDTGDLDGAAMHEPCKEDEG